MKLSLVVLSLLSLNYLVACGTSSSSSTTSTAAPACTQAFVDDYNTVAKPILALAKIEKSFATKDEKESRSVTHYIELNSACTQFYSRNTQEVACRLNLKDQETGQTTESTVTPNTVAFKDLCKRVTDAFAKGSSSTTTPTTGRYGTTTTTYGYNSDYGYNSEPSPTTRMDSLTASKLQFKVESEYSIRQLLVNPKNVMVKGRVKSIDSMTESESGGTFCKFVFDQDLSKKLLGYPTLQPLVISDTVTADGEQQSLLIVMDNAVGLTCYKLKAEAHTLKEVKDALSGIIEVSVKR